MTPEELYQAKKKAKKDARRNKEADEGKLTITSLMDIVSIIVIYLLKSYGSDPVVITPGAGQKIPTRPSRTASRSTFRCATSRSVTRRSCS